MIPNVSRITSSRDDDDAMNIDNETQFLQAARSCCVLLCMDTAGALHAVYCIRQLGMNVFARDSLHCINQEESIARICLQSKEYNVRLIDE